MSQTSSGGANPGQFPTTQWSRVVTAGSSDAPRSPGGAGGLCQAYWYPIYAYVRHRGHTPEQAQDLTQDFFAYVLEHDSDRDGRPDRGRFRSFLRTVCARHLADQRDRANARKRGGGRSPLSIDPFDAEGRYAREPAHELTPERIFDRTWALTLLCRVVDRLRREYDDAGRVATFEELRTVLTRDPNPTPTRRSPTGWDDEGAVRVAVHRLRRRYGLLLRQEIAATVDDPGEIDDEIRSLFAALED